jgi:PAS domain S-box-containing protein
LADAGTTPPAEPLLAALLLETDDGIAITDGRGVVTSWNPAAERLSGHRAEDVLGRHLAEVVPPSGRARARILLRQVLTSGRTARVQTPWERPDGHVLHVGITMSAVSADGGGAAGASVVVRDLSRQHAADRRGRQSEERMRTVVEMAHDAFVGMDGEGRINGWNRAAELLFGWTAGEVLGRSLRATILPERLRAREDELQRALEAGEGSRAPFELTVVGREGTELPVEVTLTVVRAGREWTCNAFVRDLRGRDAAAATRARLAAIVESSDDAMLSTDAAGRISSWNPGAERLYGHPSSWALGRHIAVLTPPGRAGEDERILRRVLEGVARAGRRGPSACTATGSCSRSRFAVSPRPRRRGTRRRRVDRLAVDRGRLRPRPHGRADGAAEPPGVRRAAGRRVGRRVGGGGRSSRSP